MRHVHYIIDLEGKQLLYYRLYDANYEQKLKFGTKQLLCGLFIMNDGEEDIFEVKYDKSLFDQIKKDSELESEKK